MISTKYLGLVSFFVFSITASGAWSQPLFDVATKATREVKERAAKGIPQEVDVALDDDLILARSAERRRLRRGSSFEISADMARETQELKNRVFPGGKLGEATITRDSPEVPVVQVRVPNAQALNALLANPRVRAVQHLDKLYYPALPQSLPLIAQPTALGQGKNGAGYRVAVLDTGTNYRDPVFATSGSVGCRIRGGDYPNGPYVGESGCKLSNLINFATSEAFWDRHPTSHGTLVTGIVAGTAPGAKIASLNVFRQINFSWAADWEAVRKALDWVIANRDASPGKIVAVNFSFATNELFESECRGTVMSTYFARLRELNILPIAATGNAGNKSAIGEPACAFGAVRVGSVFDGAWGRYDGPGCSDQTTRAKQVVCSSNSNTLLTLLAPGHFIEAAGLAAGGTSAAAPHVAASIAILKQAFPNEDASTLLRRLTSTGEMINDPRNNIARPLIHLAPALASITPPAEPPGPTGSDQQKASAAVQAVVPLLLEAP